MILDFDKLSSGQTYAAMIQTVVPRPIAWVLSKNENGSHNLAPFSFFNGVSGNPPLISISVGRKDNGSQKDTWKNIENRNHFVVHIPHVEMVQAMTNSSASLDEGSSEIDYLGLETVTLGNWPLPRLKETRLALLCERYAIHAIGAAPQGLILGRVKEAYLADDIATLTNNRLTVDAKALDPIARLGGNDYTTLGKILTVERPD